MNKKIRVIVADDSALMRRKISDILNSDPDIEVVAITRDGKETIKAVHDLKPDVVTLDIEMPVMNGLETLGYIMSECPTPCVMISAFTAQGTKESILSLEYGAVSFVTKPGGVISPDIEKLDREIIEKVKLASTVQVTKLKLILPKKAAKEDVVVRKAIPMRKVFAIASSTGGTQALATILPQLQADLQASVLVVQHMPEGFTKSLAERLNWQSKISVVEAEDNMPVIAGRVIIAKGGLHMEVSGDMNNAHVHLSDKPSLHGVKPSADIMMQSVARVFKKKSVGIVLTGMGTDGTLGAETIKSAGGVVMAEDESTCVIYGMPRSVIEAGIADKVVPLHNIVAEMERILK